MAAPPESCKGVAEIRLPAIPAAPASVAPVNCAASFRVSSRHPKTVVGRAHWLDELMRLITRQMFAGSPGVTASVIRLTEAMFIEAIRVCVDQDTGLRGILEAMEDPRIGRALNLTHRGLERDWTLDRVAREVGMSRSRFAERFQALMGCAPMSYLSDLRLQKAMNLLAGSGEPVQAIAARVGYRSPAAFSRAFASRYGHSPRAARRAAV